MQDKQVINVEVDILNKTLQYLSEQPFKEVADLISGLQISVQENNKQDDNPEKE